MFLAKINTPINTDSRKKAITPSAARIGPKISPTALEYPDQFMPKENSMVMPVAVPITNINPSSLTRKSVIFL